jgi:hypothetical protein
VLLLLGLLSTTLAHKSTAQRWEAEHVALAWMSTSLILGDWSTTADAVRRCGKQVICTPSVEQNPLIGSSPSLNTIRAWSLVGLTGNLVVGSLIRKRWMRTAWFASVTMIEFMVVRHNMQAGLGVSLNF